MCNTKKTMSENLTATLKLNPSDLLITLNEKLTECSNAVFFGINSLDLTTELPKTLSLEENLIFAHVPIGELTIEQSKSNFKNWILKKGFEDLITALTELLISFSFIIELNKKIIANNKTTFGEFKKLIFDPNDNISKNNNFPELIRKVSKSLKAPLKYENEVITINRVRRCLVHRNGKVRPIDFNVENGLELKWWFYEVNLSEQGEKKSLERFDLINDKSQIELKEIQRRKIYLENERVNFSFQEFNELVLFCQKFGFDVLEKFKLNK